MNRVKSLRQTRSIRTKIILGLLVVLIPLISLLLTYNFYTVTLLREKTAVSNKNTLSIYSEIVEANLQATRGQLLDTFTADNNFYKIRNSENPVSQYLATYDASKRFQSLLASGSTADLFFIYTPQHHLTFFNETFNSSLAFSERLTIRTELKTWHRQKTGISAMTGYRSRLERTLTWSISWVMTGSTWALRSVSGTWSFPWQKASCSKITGCSM